MLRIFWTIVIAAVGSFGAGAQSFVNYETPHVAPIAMSPDGSTLALCNTADNRVELFSLAGAAPEAIGAIAVGLDPVACRFRSDDELWVANHLSDSVSVIDLVTGHVVRTLTAPSPHHADLILDEPCDIVFAGDPQRAFVTFSQSNAVAVWNVADLDAPPVVVPIAGEDPRALAVSPDGSTVYAAIFESGNRSTLIGGGSAASSVISFPPNAAMDDAANPYGGVNPPPNNGAGFFPPKAPNGAAPRVGHIVKQDANGAWRDDNGTDWSDYVSGPKAAMSGRPPGWTLIDHDVARIDANTLAVDYAGGLMNICMALGVNPATGVVTVVGTDATNEVRFEPVLRGTFLRVRLGFVDDALDTSITDLNPHLDYQTASVPPPQRRPSIGDPRAIVWNAAGDRGYIAAMGSNNVIVVDASGARVGAMPMPVPEGPTGLVLDEARSRLYVVSKFAGELAVLNLAQPGLTRIAFHDPTPDAIKTGRKHLYDTHKTSGLGHVSCASCHVDARMDRLSWDLGDPAMPVKAIHDDDEAQNLGMGIPQLSDGFEDWHPMKGPMSTQTLQDIIGHEPHHWRGDRDGIEEFDGAFDGLQGSVPLSPTEMQEFEDFLATIAYPPNPYRNVDNTLRSDLPVGALGQRKTGRFGGAGDPLPAGDANNGLALYRDFSRPLDQGAFSCVICHALPTGGGANMRINDTFSGFDPLPFGPDGEAHSALVSVDGSTNTTLKVAQLRNTYEKTGCDFTQTESGAGFGLLHDGSVDSIARFISLGAFNVANDQEVADLVSLIFQFSGSDFGEPDVALPFEPEGIPSKDSHAAVGRQVTITDPADFGASDEGQLFSLLVGVAQSTNRVDLIVRQPDVEGVLRSYLLTGSKGAAVMQSDALAVQVALDTLQASASPDRPFTAMAVAGGTGLRIGLDRDEDGLYDYDEYEAGSSSEMADTDGDGLNDAVEVLIYGTDPTNPDTDGDGVSDFDEIQAGTDPLVDDSGDPADVNGDDAVNAIDVQLVINAALGIAIGPFNADVNNADGVNAVDVQLVINAALGLG